MCEPVLAYKDIAGRLHSNEEDCKISNKNIKEERMKREVEEIIVKCSTGCVNWNFIESLRVRQNLSSNWRKLRDALNLIED